MQQPLPDYTFLCREGSNFAVILRTGVPVPINVRFSDGATAVLRKNDQYLMVAMITDKRWFEVTAPDMTTSPDEMFGPDLIVYGDTTIATNVFVSWRGVLTHIRPGRTIRFV